MPKFLGSRKITPLFLFPSGSQVFFWIFGGFEAPKNPEKTIQIKNHQKANSYQASSQSRIRQGGRQGKFRAGPGRVAKVHLSFVYDAGYIPRGGGRRRGRRGKDIPHWGNKEALSILSGGMFFLISILALALLNKRLSKNVKLKPVIKEIFVSLYDVMENHG